MDINRRVLLIAVFALVGIGSCVVAIPFVKSWSVTDRTRAAAVLVNVADLKPGQWKSIDGRGERIFVVRQPTGRMVVLGVPLRNGVVMMPDIHWWHPEYPCVDFSLSVFDGQVTSASRFQCRALTATQDWAKGYWIWDSEGRTVGRPGNFIDDIPSIPYEMHDGVMVIKRGR